MLAIPSHRMKLLRVKTAKQKMSTQADPSVQCSVGGGKHGSETGTEAKAARPEAQKWNGGMNGFG